MEEEDEEESASIHARTWHEPDDPLICLRHGRAIICYLGWLFVWFCLCVGWLLQEMQPPHFLALSGGPCHNPMGRCRRFPFTIVITPGYRATPTHTRLPHRLWAESTVSFFRAGILALDILFRGYISCVARVVTMTHGGGGASRDWRRTDATRPRWEICSWDPTAMS